MPGTVVQCDLCGVDERRVGLQWTHWAIQQARESGWFCESKPVGSLTFCPACRIKIATTNGETLG